MDVRRDGKFVLYLRAGYNFIIPRYIYPKLASLENKKNIINSICILCRGSYKPNNSIVSIC